tara:strand:- start:6297 stop:6635 length:339 start_codon:yes stop_codon:yes gene_type:complete
MKSDDMAFDRFTSCLWCEDNDGLMKPNLYSFFTIDFSELVYRFAEMFQPSTVNTKEKREIFLDNEEEYYKFFNEEVLKYGGKLKYFLKVLELQSNQMQTHMLEHIYDELKIN